MEIFSERTLRSSLSLSEVRSWPSNRTVPAVGSSSPLSVRSRVDLPDPDRPMTTNIWPSSTSIDASITAAVVPSARRSSRLGAGFELADRVLGSSAEHFVQVLGLQPGHIYLSCRTRNDLPPP